MPLMPTAILWSLMNLADKYAILWFVGAAGNGIYAVAHKIPTILSVIYGIFQQAWQLTTFELESREDRSKAYTSVFELVTCILFCVGAFLIVLNRVYITYFCESSYLVAWKITPILMYSAILNSISGLLGSNYLIMHDTKSALKVTTIGALINAILNFLLVPILGLYGASIATVIGYFYMVAKKYFDTSKFTPLSLKINRFILVNVLSVIMIISVSIRNDVVYYLVNLLITVFIAWLYKDQFGKVISLIMNRFKKKVQ